MLKRTLDTAISDQTRTFTHPVEGYTVGNVDIPSWTVDVAIANPHQSGVGADNQKLVLKNVQMPRDPVGIITAGRAIMGAHVGVVVEFRGGELSSPVIVSMSRKDGRPNGPEKDSRTIERTAQTPDQFKTTSHIQVAGPLPPVTNPGFVGPPAPAPKASPASTAKLQNRIFILQEPMKLFRKYIATPTATPPFNPKP